MSADSSPLISTVPENELFIQVSRKADNYTTGVYYQLESTASKLYYFKPRYGSIDPEQESYVYVFLLPFDLEYPANRNHELIVQSMLAGNEKEEDLPQLFEHTNPAQIRTRRVKCIPYEYEILAIEPNHELLFEGSFDLPFSSNISLYNGSDSHLYFDVQTSSTDLSVFPSEGAVNKFDSKDLIVIRKPLSSSHTNDNTDTITIRESTSSDMFVQDSVLTKLTTIKCVYTTPKTTPSTGDCQRSISDLRNVD
ncbi:unnamed protein product [Dicrocoelium dendriticum]|nr:unnamed protein product [Dicrocoelium dendriticum]